MQQRDKTGMIPAYNTKPKDNGFESTITIDGKTYTSSKAHKRKKDAEEEVAKIAFEDLKIDKTRKTGIHDFFFPLYLSTCLIDCSQ